jgi:hypothetical protein
VTTTTTWLTAGWGAYVVHVDPVAPVVLLVDQEQPVVVLLDLVDPEAPMVVLLVDPEVVVVEPEPPMVMVVVDPEPPVVVLLAPRPAMLSVLTPAMLEVLTLAMLEVLTPAMLEVLTLRPAMLEVLTPAMLEVLRPAMLELNYQNYDSITTKLSIAGARALEGDPAAFGGCHPRASARYLPVLPPERAGLPDPQKGYPQRP